MDYVRYGNEPCPRKIVYGIGTGFCVGTTIGTVVQSHQGYSEAPKRASKRFLGIVNAVKIGTPKWGTGFAVWAGSMDAVECCLREMRGKQDVWNRVIGGGVAAGIVAVPRGCPTMIGVTITMFTLLALYEGVIILTQDLQNRWFQHGVPIDDHTNQGPAYESNQSQETVPFTAQHLPLDSTKM